MKRVMTIQDISCIGKCSLTVALPIISCFGLETAIVPTAVLSAHTYFSGVTFRDLTEDLDSIKEHWKKEGFTFDTLYSGYLGSERQIEIVRDYFRTFGKKGSYKIVDPVMADNGKLYTGFDEHFPEKLFNLCKEADIILPNISEAALMLGKKYPGENASPEVIRELLKGLTEQIPGTAIITGVTLDNGDFGFMGLNKKGEFFEYGNPKVNYRSHGTGDIFASTFTGAVTCGLSCCDSLALAADFVTRCIANTLNDPDRVNYAVNFETELPWLTEQVKKIKER